MRAKEVWIIAVLVVILCLAPHQTARIEHTEVLTQYLHIDNTEWEYDNRREDRENVRSNSSLSNESSNASERLRQVTAYTSYPNQTSGNPCIGAWGDDLCKLYKQGQMACASNAYPRGTRLHVEGYGTCTVLDRMNSRYPDRVDIYMGYDTAEALNWGVKTVKVYEM
jgi:3D (Asp-Asp-Asp) domain-containing protein